MTSLWNEKTIAEPPMCCTLVSITPENTGCLSTLKEILQECVTELNSQPHLSAEVFVLSSLIYKKNCQLRRDKSLQGLKLILKCLTRYNEVNMYQIAMKLQQGFNSYNPGSFVKSVYLPSRQSMEHFLVKLMGVTCLLSQMVNYAVHTFVLLNQRLCRGHLIPINLVALSSISRVWAMCKSMALMFLSWYSRLRPAIQVLTPAQVKWIPDNDTLPEDLAQFVYDETGVDLRTSDQDVDLMEMFDKVRHEHEEPMKDNGETDSGETEDHEWSGHVDDDIYINNEDIGVPIKKTRHVKPEDETAKETPQISDGITPLPCERESGFEAEINNNLTDTENMLDCVNKSHSFNELRSLLIKIKEHTQVSLEFQTDWEKSMTVVKRLKKKSSTNEESGEESIVNVRVLKKAKRSVRNLINKYCRLTDTSEEQVCNLTGASLDEENQTFELTDTERTHSHHNPSSSTVLDLQRTNLNAELKTKRKHLRKVIKGLRMNSHLEYEGKIIDITSAESEKLRKQLQQLLKQLKKLSCMKTRDYQREMELMNTVDSLLENAAAEQAQNICSKLQTTTKLKNKKRKALKREDNKLHVQTGLSAMQKDTTQVIKSKKLKKLRKGKTIGKKRLA